MRPVLRLLAASLLLAGLLMPGVARGQQGERVIGRFRVSRGTATLAPEAGGGEGAITWRCGSDTAGPAVSIRLGRRDSAAVVTYAVWRFDDAKADTAFLRSLWRRSEGWLGEESAAFTRRARTAARLTVRVLGNPPTEPGAEHAYDLRDAGRALGRLPCVRNPSSERPVVGWPPPEGLVVSPDGGARTYEAGEVDRPPEPVNLRELMRALLRAYPPLMRDAGEGGTVVLRFRVLEDGRVDGGAVTVLRSTGEALPAVTARWLPLLHFRPARVGGRPVRAWVELPVTYEMRGSPPTRPTVRPGL